MWVFGCVFYVEGGIWGVEVGGVMLGMVKNGKEFFVVSENIEDEVNIDEEDDEVFEIEVEEYEELFCLVIFCCIYIEFYIRWVFYL